jgi:hypothetical protein
MAFLLTIESLLLLLAVAVIPVLRLVTPVTHSVYRTHLDVSSLSLLHIPQVTLFSLQV